jgi:hypothetical protein
MRWRIWLQLVQWSRSGQCTDGRQQVNLQRVGPRECTPCSDPRDDLRPKVGRGAVSFLRKKPTQPMPSACPASLCPPPIFTPRCNREGRYTGSSTATRSLRMSPTGPRAALWPGR